MSDLQYPICYTGLEAHDVAPCFDCGDDPRELEDWPKVRSKVR